MNTGLRKVALDQCEQDLLAWMSLESSESVPDTPIGQIKKALEALHMIDMLRRHAPGEERL